jgi:radical SAM superfamily enzyme YgiQ (UPF0313 family)
MRPVREIVRELDAIPSRNIFFVDDSLGLNREEARKLFSEMAPLRKFWIGEGTVSLAEDPGLLRSMKRSGCQGLLVGFESVDEKSRQQMGKHRALRIRTSEVVRRFHEEGIAVCGAFIFGFDHQDKTIFDRTIEFVKTQKIGALQLGVLCPFPGTRLYARLLEEGRLYDPKWWLKGYPPFTLLFRLKGMSQVEFLDGIGRVVRELHSFRSLVRGFFGISPWRRPVRSLALYAGINLAHRKSYFNNLSLPQPFSGI